MSLPQFLHRLLAMVIDYRYDYCAVCGGGIAPWQKHSGGGIYFWSHDVICDTAECRQIDLDKRSEYWKTHTAYRDDVGMYSVKDNVSGKIADVLPTSGDFENLRLVERDVGGAR